MTSTDRLVAGVIGALFAPPARLYEMNAAFGVLIDCVALAATMEVMMTTTVAMRMTPGRENFCIRIVIAFILFGFLLCFGFFCWFSRAYQMSVSLPARVRPPALLWTQIVSALATRMSTVWLMSRYTMWVPIVGLCPWVIAAGLYDSKPTHPMQQLGICNKVT